MSAHAAPTDRSGLLYAGPQAHAAHPRRRLSALAATRRSATAWVTLGLGAALAAISFVASGGLSIGSATSVEMTLTLAGGAAVAAAMVARPSTRPLHGAWPTALLFALAILCALSVVWSVQPDASWQEASRTLAYAATFALAVAWVRVAPGSWSSVLGGVIVAAVAVSGWALLTKVFPGQLNAQEIYARLREPYGYWNAIGLTAALGVPACVWLGARQSGHRALNALAYPATGLLLVTLMLAYSRGALLTLAIGLVVWFTAVPLRLRGAAVLLTAAAGALVVILWAFSQHALTSDRIPVSERATAGHQLGILLLALLLALLVAGLAIAFATDSHPPAKRLRRRAGAVLLVALALIPVVVVGGLTASSRGLFGSISHAARQLTDPHAKVPPNDPSRLTAIGSVRARYWNDGLKVFRANAVLGSGAGGYATARLRYREDTLNVQHAHGYVIQTLADLGIIGLLVNLALLVAWAAAALRSTRLYGLRVQRSAAGVEAGAPGGVREAGAPGAASGRTGVIAMLHGHGPGRWRVARRAEPFTAERIGLTTMLAVVVVFGVHSLIDWTWFVPGNACVALLCAGWLAGRGPLRADDAALAEAGGAARARALAGAGAAADGARAPLPERLKARAADLRDGAAAVARRAGPQRLVAAAAIIAVALLAAWTEWQPLRSVDATNTALAAVDRHNLKAAQASLQSAIHRDPVAVNPLFELAAIQGAAGQRPAAHATLIRAVRLQPSNPQTWLELAGFDLYTVGDAKTALNDLRAALYLDPQNLDAQGEFVAALRRANPSTPVTAAVPPVPPSNPGPVGPSG